MGDLAAFLAARLDEDEKLARNTISGWRAHWHPPADAKLARWDRVLREVEAKRAILAEHSPHEVQEGPEKGTMACGAETDWNDSYLMVTAWPCATVRALASVYQDHPDYNPAWG